jgi:hypothetical protein
VHQVPDSRAIANNWSHSREASQQIHVIDSGTEVKSCVNVDVKVGDAAKDLAKTRR